MFSKFKFQIFSKYLSHKSYAYIKSKFYDQRTFEKLNKCYLIINFFELFLF